MVFLMLQTFSSMAYDFEVDGIYYNVTDLRNLECEVTSGENKYEGSVKIPSRVIFGPKTFIVKKIGDKAFQYCQELTFVELPKSTESIGNEAFSVCTSLKIVNIPDSVLNIGAKAFEYAKKLWNVSIGDAVTDIGDHAFYNCESLTDLKIGKSVKNIGMGAFSGCESLKSAILPDGVETLGAYAFYECRDLSHVELGNSLKELNNATFYLCDLKKIRIPGSVDRIVGHSSVSEHAAVSGIQDLSLPYSKKELVLGAYGYDNVFITKTGPYPESAYFESGLGWITSVTTLYIDRQLSTVVSLPHLSVLSLGKNIKKVQVRDLQSCEELKTIRCDAPEPPVLPECSTKQFLNVEVEVPLEFLEKYKQAPVWKDFWNLKGYDSSK